MLRIALILSLIAAGPSQPPDPAPEPEKVPAEATVETDSAAEVFVIKCSGCHTVGRGKLTGPDLETSTTWPETDLAAGIERMIPKTGPLGTAEVQSLVELLKDADVGGRLTRQESRIAQRFAAQLDPASPEDGGALFRGKLPFRNQGLPCASCHRAGSSGGNLAPDLTHAFANLGRLGLVSATENANFPVMRTAYRDHRVTQQEALHIAAYLESVDLQQEYPSGDPPVLLLGFVLGVATLGLFTLANRNPRRGVRARLVRDANRS